MGFDAVSFHSSEEVVRFVWKHKGMVQMARNCFEIYGEDSDCCCDFAAYTFKTIRKEGHQVNLPFSG